MGRDIFSPPFDENEYKAQNFGEVPEFESPYPVYGSKDQEVIRTQQPRRIVPPLSEAVAQLPIEVTSQLTDEARRKVEEAYNQNPPRHPDIYTCH